MTAATPTLPSPRLRLTYQGQGVGGRLIRHRLDELGAAGTPAYLEASCARNGRLYERLGFALIAPAIGLPDGPTIYPMWRPPCVGVEGPSSRATAALRCGELTKEAL